MFHGLVDIMFEYNLTLGDMNANNLQVFCVRFVGNLITHRIFMLISTDNTNVFVVLANYPCH